MSEHERHELPPSLARCKACRAVRPLSELLRVRMNTGETFMVCRPLFSLDVFPGACFRARVPSAFLAKIELAEVAP